MKQIHDENRAYRFLLPLVNWMFRHSYRHIKYVGKENIPTDGAVIFAPNHTNALQDALAVLSINSERKVFVARADIFRNKKIAKILRWLKIMPIRRMRDGASEVLQNDETENKATGGYEIAVYGVHPYILLNYHNMYIKREEILWIIYLITTLFL